MTAPMDQASEMMFWSQPGVFIDGFNLGNIRQLGGHIRPLMAHAFGVDWTVADQLKEQHDLVGIALKSSSGVDYETYMTSRQVREHMQDQNFDAVSFYGMVEHTRTYDSFCGTLTGSYWARPEDADKAAQAIREFFDTGPDFGPLSPIEPVSDTGERPQPRRFPYPVC